MDVGGRCSSTNSCAINHRASFLLVESSTVDLIERLGSWLSLERSMMKSSTLFECGPLPPYVHLLSTRCHSHDRCSQAFPIFRRSSAFVYYTELKPKNTKRGRPGNEASMYQCVFAYLHIGGITRHNWPPAWKGGGNHQGILLCLTA